MTEMSDDLSFCTDLLDALPAAIYTTDAEGKLTYFNQAAADLWGYRPDLGRSYWCGSWRLFSIDGSLLPHDQCPMAITLKEGRAVRGIEAIAERPDGTRVRFLPYPTPLRDSSGRIAGAINLLIDVTEQRRLEVDTARLAAIVASSDDAIVSKTLEGRITSWNAGAARIFGYSADEMIGQPITKIIPAELHEQEEEILRRLRLGDYVEHFETVRVAKDGRRINMSITISPLHDKSGRVIGASKIGRDITERKQAETLQRLLVDELNHRVKNTLATVQAIARQSLRRARSPSDFVDSFTGRVQALASAHTLLTQNTFQGAQIMDLVREQALLGAPDDVRVTCSGPLLLLDAQMALHLALVLHELATNARKYGALSVPQGRLSVDWSVVTNNGRVLFMRWKEKGGPKVSAPSKHGFGTILVEHALRAHGGEAVIQYGADGVTCDIRLPLPLEAPMAIVTSTAAPHTAEQAHAPRPAGWPGVAASRILVIEDEPFVSMDLEASLLAAGCEVVGPAGTLDAARRLIAASQFEAALLDVNLAGHSADDLAAELTRLNVPFAFVTGYGREGLPLAFRDAPLLSKPFNYEGVSAIVETLLARKPDVVVPLRSKQAQ